MFKRSSGTIEISTDTAREQAALLRGHADLLTQAAEAADAKRSSLRELVEDLGRTLRSLERHL